MKTLFKSKEYFFFFFFFVRSNYLIEQFVHQAASNLASREVLPGVLFLNVLMPDIHSLPDRKTTLLKINANLCCNYTLLPTYFFSFLFLDFIYLFLERGKRKGEREGEKHWSIAPCMHPDWGPNRQPRHVSWPETETATF